MERPKTPIDLDHEFDGGSGIVLSKLTNTQIENLALLGKVWGFLKYHHQSVIAGQHHWDYELFRVLPKLLAAADREAGNAAVRDWIRGMGWRFDPHLRHWWWEARPRGPTATSRRSLFLEA